MSEQSQAKGSIYDLGYRRYEGVRLGRAAALTALYVHSLRSCFGLGRRASSKIIPFGLAILVFVPAAIQLGIAAIVSDEFQAYTAVGYFAYTQSILALFAAAVAPEMIGRDQRNRTLSLYFSRALTRTDYAIAKFAAFTTAMLSITFLPQVLLFIGGGMAGNDLNGYFKDKYDTIPAIFASSITVSVLVALVSLAIASQTPRRAYATGTILGLFLITFILGGIFSEINDGENNVMLLFSPFWMLEGTTYWFFKEALQPDEPASLSGFAGVVFFIAVLAWCGVCGYLFHRRIKTVAA